MTRIGGDPVTNLQLKNTWDWAAIDTLVGLTKVNVDAVQTSGRIRETTAIDTLVENTIVNVNAVCTHISNSQTFNLLSTVYYSFA